MQPLRYLRATSYPEVLAATTSPGAAFIAGGTTLIDLMRLEVMQPALLVDITPLPFSTIEENTQQLRIGSLASNSAVAYHPAVKRRWPALSQALLSGASPQIRNMASVGGNLLQRTRCAYFRDLAEPCNKRKPGAGCAALQGYTRMHAILGGSSHCIAVHPSDMCVAMVALDATVYARGPKGERSIPIRDFHSLPDDRPDIENVLAPGELITLVTLPATPMAARSTYLKVRDRASFAFALVSVAAAVEVKGGIIQNARIALGGVATKPWRSDEAEKALVGQRANLTTYKGAADVALAGAQTHKDNAFKVELARRTIVRALQTLEAGA
jgi:xanthine dehydrogenase YagS FAD-binding subunit